MRYKSTDGKWFHSLADACLSCVDEDVPRQQQQQQQIVPKSDLPCCPRNLVVLNKKQKMKRVKDFLTTKWLKEDQNFLKIDRVQYTPQFTLSPQRFTHNTRLVRKNSANFGSHTYSFKIVLNIDVSNQQHKKRRKTTIAGFDSSPPGEDKSEIRGRTGKSLDKVLQVMEKKNKKCEKEYVRFWRKDCGPEMNYDVCCLYHRDGELLLCDGCPSAFHYTCLGLSSLPKEKLWFCPCCCCDVCGSIETSGNIKLMTCEQCQRRFCSHQCSRVTSALKSLLGCKIAVGDEGDLVWTLMRAPNEDEHYADEQISKLGSAVKILHQGSGRDLVEELIFKKDDVGVGRGFYTVMIEKNNEPITWLQ
uniref:PHD-type domain-containing protein n=2 Tax=Brassica TaxID=3705 RepID=A0A3P6FBW6_BRAOL|nr:unnamed protein product [Brassica oleracea]